MEAIPTVIFTITLNLFLMKIPDLAQSIRNTLPLYLPETAFLFSGKGMEIGPGSVSGRASDEAEYAGKLEISQ